MTDVDEHETIRRPLAEPFLAPPWQADADGDSADTVLRHPGAPVHRPSPDGDEEPHPKELLCFRVADRDAELIVEEDVHIGRNPRPPRAGDGRQVRLLRVDSPTGVISGSHLGLRRVGSTAVAVDLMSTNGTVVVLPGFPPRRLRQGETLVIPPGTRLEIGEGIVIEVRKQSGLG